MNPKVYNASYLINPEDLNFNIDVEIHVTRFLNNQKPQYHFTRSSHDVLYSDNEYTHNNNFKVFLESNEPKVCYMKELEEDVLKYSNYYNLILTTNETILKNVKHAVLFPFGTTWLNKNSSLDLGEISSEFQGFEFVKTNSISFLKTNKSLFNINRVQGYALRELIWPLKEKINYTTNFYYSNLYQNFKSNIENDGPLPNDDKLELFKSNYSIIIENSKEKNYFSEKLIDCLLTKTIPFYWGCPNIENYFDVKGFILFEDENDFLNKVNKIDLNNHYEKNLLVINNNFEQAKKYATNYGKRIETIIKKYCK